MVVFIGLGVLYRVYFFNDGSVQKPNVSEQIQYLEDELDRQYDEIRFLRKELSDVQERVSSYHEQETMDELF